MLMKPILALSLLSSTCFGVLRLLKDIENFKKEAAYMLHFSVRLTANLQ